MGNAILCEPEDLEDGKVRFHRLRYAIARGFVDPLDRVLDLGCGSGLKAVMLAAQAIALKDAEVVVAGGLENMSQAPFYLDQVRTGYRMGNGVLIDSLDHDGLRDINNDFLMGVSAEYCAEKTYS